MQSGEKRIRSPRRPIHTIHSFSPILKECADFFEAQCKNLQYKMNVLENNRSFLPYLQKNIQDLQKELSAVETIKHKVQMALRNNCLNE